MSGFLIKANHVDSDGVAHQEEIVCIEHTDLGKCWVDVGCELRYSWPTVFASSLGAHRWLQEFIIEMARESDEHLNGKVVFTVHRTDVQVIAPRVEEPCRR